MTWDTNADRYEPVHGSTPDIAGNRDAVAGTLRNARPRTADLGGNATTADVASAVLHAMESQG